MVAAIGFNSCNGLYEEICNDYDNVIALGDCRRVRNIAGAIWDGYEAARML